MRFINALGKMTGRISYSFILGKIGLPAFMITLFLLPFPQSWARYSLALVFLSGLILWFKAPGFLSKKIFSDWILITPFIIYFILHVIYGLAEGFDFALIGKRVNYLLIPVIAYPVLRCSFRDENRQMFIMSFSLGLAVVSFFLLSRAALIGMGYLHPSPVPINSIDAFSKSSLVSALSLFQHPSYFSLELNLGIVLLFSLPWKHRYLTLARISMIILFLVMIILLGSRAGLLALIVSLFVLAAMAFKTKIEKTWTRLAALASVLMILVLVLALNPRVKNSLVRTRSVIAENGIKGLTDIEPRSRVWSSAIELINDKPLFGYGVNTADQKLVNEYRKRGYYQEAFFRLNCHNQFLESQLSFGIAGLVLIIWMLFLPVIRQVTAVAFPGVIFSIMLFVHQMFESMMMRQLGILVPVIFIVSIFSLKSGDEALNC
ncbi:MAG: O-antigen ligase family protein [Bacteroidales bacterium]